MLLKKILLAFTCLVAFSFAKAQEVKYTAPKNISPEEGKNLNNKEKEVMVNFRWTPVLPRPKEDVVYKIRLMEIKPGQPKAQAVTNKPLAALEIDNATQTSFKLAKRCNDCEYLWDVEAVVTEKGTPKSLGKSQATQFTIDGIANGERLGKRNTSL
ncbi:MAG TPA: hypothetical protein PLZ45_11590 [Ferruginibacter sp.]|nr:hypothetical protein [Ferruginibacter sp.]